MYTMQCHGDQHSKRCKMLANDCQHSHCASIGMEQRYVPKKYPQNSPNINDKWYKQKYFHLIYKKIK